MTDDAPSNAEIWRAFTDFRDETRDQYKFVIRLLIGTLTSAVVASALSALFVVLTRPPS